MSRNLCACVCVCICVNAAADMVCSACIISRLNFLHLRLYNTTKCLCMQTHVLNNSQFDIDNISFLMCVSSVFVSLHVLSIGMVDFPFQIYAFNFNVNLLSLNFSISFKV